MPPITWTRRRTTSSAIATDLEEEKGDRDRGDGSRGE
jgi:hypothetical protein